MDSSTVNTTTKPTTAWGLFADLQLLKLLGVFKNRCYSKMYMFAITGICNVVNTLFYTRLIWASIDLNAYVSVFFLYIVFII